MSFSDFIIVMLVCYAIALSFDGTKEPTVVTTGLPQYQCSPYCIER